MNRRTFLGTNAATGLSRTVPAAEARNQYIELSFYNLSGGAAGQSNRLAAFLEHEHLPMTKRHGISPVGYFALRPPPEPVRPAQENKDDVAPRGDTPRIVTLKAYESWSAVEARRLARREDSKWIQAVDEFSAGAQAYDRMESCLLRAFDGLPEIEVPPASTRKNPRLFDLRIAESPSFRAATLKIEQFNTGEIQIFRRCGLNPVFFGETLFGSRMPNLWFMIWYDDREARDAAWEAFRNDPGWVKMQKDPRWAKTVSQFADTFLQPLPFSPIR